MTIIRSFFVAFFAVSLMFIVGVAGSVFLTNRYFFAVGQEEVVISGETLVEIPYGSSLRRVSEILKEAGLIDDASRFYWYLRLGRADGLKIQAGFYEFLGSITKQALAKRLLSGYDQSWRLTFKEGQTLKDLAAMLETMGLASQDDFVAAMQSDEIVNLIKAPQARKRKALNNDMGGIEGYLFPDTYFFSKRDSALAVIRTMYERLIALLDEDMLARMDELHLSLHDVLTLASIIEKETGAPEERPAIASVYKNRLRLGMRLQADPTVIYGIKDYDGKIRKKDLLTHHPYNTYTMKGLPPGPIASPGLASIRAALWPSDTKYLYFVSKNDGSHEFCENLSCHNKAVKRWQIDYFKERASRAVNN